MTSIHIKVKQFWDTVAALQAGQKLRKVAELTVVAVTVSGPRDILTRYWTGGSRAQTRELIEIVVPITVSLDDPECTKRWDAATIGLSNLQCTYKDDPTMCAFLESHKFSSRHLPQQMCQD